MNIVDGYTNIYSLPRMRGRIEGDSTATLMWVTKTEN